MREGNSIEPTTNLKSRKDWQVDETTTGLLIGERVKFVGVFFRFGGGEEDGGESVVARTENEPEEEESVNLDEKPTNFKSAQCGFSSYEVQR